MVITPEQAKQKTIETDKERLASLEKTIDREIARQFNPRNDNGVIAELPEIITGPGDPLYRAIKEIYSNAGWKVCYEKEPQDLDLIKLIPKRGRRNYGN